MRQIPRDDLVGVFDDVAHLRQSERSRLRHTLSGIAPRARSRAGCRFVVTGGPGTPARVRNKLCRPVPIVIHKLDNGYAADVTPPHGQGRAWSSPHPMSRDELVAALRRIGCYQTDIGDAFFEADPRWLDR